MRYYRCKCGKAQYFASGMVPQDCEGCDECGTTYALISTGHKERIPHDWKPQFNRDTGEPDRAICRRCMARQSKQSEEPTTIRAADNG